MSTDPGLDGVEAIRARLDDAVADLQSVSTAPELAELIAGRDLPPRSPASFVVDLGDKAGQATVAAGFHRQRIQQRIGVLTVVTYSGKAGARRAQAELEALRKPLADALVAWSPGGSFSPLSLVDRRQIRNERSSAHYYLMQLETHWNLEVKDG